MCGDCFRIKVCNRFAPNKVAVKCGICPECRKIEQNAWSFRLRCELEDCHNKGWKIGFLTLTYDSENLPYIPDALIDRSKSFGDYPCFNKSQVKDFIISIRKKLYDDYGIGKHSDGIKYLVASEFGKHTQRPHYHMVISWPSYADLDAEKMLSLIRERWSFGFVFPRHHLGGLDSHGYKHQPFEVTSNPFACCKYISKYICKDLDFFASLDKFFPVESADLSNYFPFHIQSKSLGFSRLIGLSDAEKLKYIRDGYSFIGEDKLVPIPLYFKRKILFSPKYIVEREVYRDGVLVRDYDSDLSDADLFELGFDVKYRRLVRREATDFFKSYYPKIFDKQLDSYTKLFSNVFDKNYLVSRGIESNTADDFLHFLSYSRLSSPRDFAASYLCYFGLSIDKCYDVEASYQWFLRYDDNFEPPSCFFRIDSDFYDEVNTFVPIALSLCISSKKVETLSDKIAASVSDYWKSAI